MPSPRNTLTQGRTLHFVYAYGEWEVVLNGNDPEHPIERDHLGDGEVYMLIHKGEPVATCSTHCLRIVTTWSDGSGDHDHYVGLRVESLVDAKQWAMLPWKEYGPGELIVAWNHYDDMISRHDERSGSFAIASWREVESALGRGEHELHFHDGRASVVPPIY